MYRLRRSWDSAALLALLLFLAPQPVLGRQLEAAPVAVQNNEGRAALLGDKQNALWSQLFGRSRVQLTERGRSAQTIVLAAIGHGYCQGADWRGSLPRFLATVMPRATVLRWQMFDWSTRPEVLSSLLDRDGNYAAPKECDICTSTGLQKRAFPELALMGYPPKHKARSFPCDLYWQSGHTADMVLIMGHGPIIKRTCDDGEPPQPLRAERQQHLPTSEYHSTPCLPANTPAAEKLPALATLLKVRYACLCGSNDCL